MMNEPGFRRVPPDQSLGSGHTFGTPRHPSISDPILSKRVCFYKSGDPQFNGLRMVINNRTFKTFDALLDSLSKKVPLPFGVRNITTPRGVHAVYTLDELEDGKSYICSDSRKVKPINLALARKKLPPWYNARPVSSRRRTVQKARIFPGRNIHKQEPGLVRTPKRLLVFRNGDPSVKHSVVLHKRTTTSFESVLEYISEVIQFHVVKLHTADGRRVDGLPGLILCSGTVVAVGREPFKPANYNAQKSPAPTMPPTKQMGHRRLKRKNKPLSYTSKSRNFSPSSERYIVNRIHNSIAESSCDLPSQSAALESGRMLESVPETPETCCVGAEGQDGFLPAEDDIEKSFRVNQDGSMTVEMRVRLTIKEEETIHWTTTLARSSVANQLNVTHFPEPDISSLKSDSLDLQSPAASIDTINKDKTQDYDDEDPPSLSNGAFSESSHEEGDVKVQMSPRRAPTPGHKQIRKKQASVESMTSVTAEGVQEGMVGSYSYREQTENGAVTEQYCMVKKSSSKPVPKPRRLGSVDANISNVSTFKAAEMTEVQQIESSGDEVTETVLHVYEQRTCQDNFFANLSGIPFCRPATSETGQLSSSNEFEPQLWRPSTASESVSVWKAESTSGSSDSMSPSQRQQQFPKAAKGKDKPQQREVSKDKRVSSKPNVVNARIRRLTPPGKRLKENSAGAAEKSKKVKTFSSLKFIKKIYGSKSKSAKIMTKLKKGPALNGDGGGTTKSSQQLDDKCTLKDPNTPSVLKQTTSETVSSEKSNLNVTPNEISPPRGILTRQTSMHREKKNKNESCDVSGSMLLPPVNSSSSVTNEYVENWLEKAYLNPTAYPDEESQHLEALGQTENGSCGKSENKMILADEVKDTTPLERTASVKQRIKSFESKSSGPSMEKTPDKQHVAKSHITPKNTENSNSLAQIKTDRMQPLSSEIIPPTKETSTEVTSGSENKSSQIKFSIQNATPSFTLSMEFPLPPPPPPDENTALSITEYCMMDAPSVASSPLYRLSSVSSQMSDNQPLSISPTSDKAVSSADHTTEMTTSIHSDIPSTEREASLPRTPSIKKAPLVSNTSLDRNMSLRKACLDKYTLCSDAASETSTSSTSINIAGDNVLSNGICSTGPSETPPEERDSILNMKSSPSCCTSASPTSSASEERMSPASISSSEAPTRSDLPFKETKTSVLTEKEASSPKPLVKHVKLSSLSLERKSKKLSSDLPHNSPKLSLHNHPPDKTTSPNIGKRRHGTPYASPTTERKLYRPKSQKRRSPYAQSLDVSPPVRHKSSGKVLSRNLAPHDASEQTNKTHRKSSSRRKRHQTSQLIKLTAELDKALICSAFMPLEADQSDDNKVTDDLITADQEKSVTPIMPQPLNITNTPNMTPVLEKICYSIKSIRQITQNKRPSCLERSNSLPDFSSHVASTFGSSSKALLAFLSVMTLKEGLTTQNMDELNTNNVSCAEALKMIDSLREIASIEDSHELKVSLANLQRSASKQLLQSWKGFQDLGEKCRSRSSTPKHAAQEVVTKASPERDCSIDEIVDNLDIPEQLKEELTSLSVGVKSDSDNEEKIKKVEPKDAKISHLSIEVAANVRDVAQDEKACVDVSSIIKKFTDINKPKQASITKDTKGKESLNGQNGVAKCPPAEPIDKPEETQLYSAVLFEDQGKQDHIEDQAKAKINVVVGSKRSLEQDSTSEVEEQDMEGDPMHSDESGSDKEGQNMSSASKDLEQIVSCKQSVSGARQQHSSEEEPEVEIQQENRESEDSSNPESHSEEEEEKQPSLDYYVEVDVRGQERISRPDSQNKSEEDEPEVECEAGSIEPKNEVDENTSDVDDTSSEEEQPELGCMKLKVIIEETSSGNEEEEEEHPVHLLDHRQHIKKGLSLIKEAEEEDMVSSDDADRHEEGDLSNLIENEESYTKKGNNSLTKSYGFDADEDSGNDHSSCEEHTEVEQPKAEDEPNNNSSYDEKESGSEEEHGITDRYIEETEYQEAPALTRQFKDTTCEKAVEKVKHQSEEIMSQSVAERVSLLEKQVADAQKTTGGSAIRCSSQRNAPLESDVEDSPSESPTSQSAPGTRSAPQSSLSFSYDSSGVITTEPESNRVRLIREMFLAKSATDIQHGCYPSRIATEPSELRAETSASGGYQSQTSSELSSGEDDSARKSITKGFVRRTIERLYGKKDAEDVSERPPSAPKQKQKDHTSIFSPFHIARAKALSEMSYFSSTNALDSTLCAAFNAQVGPEDSVPVDDEQWVLRENTMIRKSASDPAGLNKKSPPSEGMCEDTEEDTPYSLFSSKSEVEDKKAAFSRKCTYFSLPHASDSEPCQDEISTVSKSSVNGDSITDTKDNPEDTKSWPERNGKLPGAGVTDFKMMDNKVHPLTEPPPHGEAVVTQPGKGQGVMARRIQEPDMLDIIYNFCGQNCPIL